MTTILPFLLPACSKDDEPGEGRGRSMAIEFDTPFIEMTSRSESGQDIPFSEFKVYGFVNKADSYIYDGDIVSRQPDGSWVCDRTEYWYPGKLYFFTGIVPVDSKGLNFIPTKKNNATLTGGGTFHYDIGISQAKEDLLYAFSGTMKTPVTTPTYMPEVEMKFKHLLSRLTLTFHNDLVNPHYFVNAHSIMLCNVSAKGTINMTQPKPSWQREGTESAWIGINPLYIIKQTEPSQTTPVYLLPLPVDESWMEIRIQVFYTADPNSTQGYPVTDEQLIKVPFPKINPEAGRSYNLVCHLTPDNVLGDSEKLVPISFTVHDETWRWHEDFNVEVP